jgi:DNA repair exonuclease SbcCD ATPase subunit
MFICRHCREIAEGGCSLCYGKGYIEDYENKWDCHHCKDEREAVEFVDNFIKETDTVDKIKEIIAATIGRTFTDEEKELIQCCDTLLTAINAKDKELAELQIELHDYKRACPVCGCICPADTEGSKHNCEENLALTNFHYKDKITELTKELAACREATIEECVSVARNKDGGYRCINSTQNTIVRNLQALNTKPAEEK